MCFSATASFVAAGITGVIGLATITQPRTLKEAPLAAMPLLFSMQQMVEGILWLTLPHAGSGGVSSVLTHVYLGLALAFWPVFAPLSVWLLEPQALRRWIMAACLLIGVGVAMYFAVSVLNSQHVARIEAGHIVYLVQPGPLSVGGFYLFATGIALMLSSHRLVAAMGAIVFVGSVVSYFFYYGAYVSVWCFFAAASSTLLLLHFYRLRATDRLSPRQA